MKFSELGLASEIQKSLQEIDFNECTAIQEQVIPLAIQGKDISGLAQTGTGKTAAFVIPLLHRILQARIEREGKSDEEWADLQKTAFRDWQKRNFILVLVPTRELAEQVSQEVQKFGKHGSIRSVSIYGGVDYDKQKKQIDQGAEFIVATPGRLIDLYKSHIVDLKQVRAVVFDEADRMFDMGFKDDMVYVLRRIPQDRQFMVFSATLNFDVIQVAYEFQAQPIECHIDRDSLTAENVEHSLYHVGEQEKPAYLLSLYKKKNPKNMIVFSNYRNNVERISLFLSNNDIPAVGISSLLTQNQRNRVMEQFRNQSKQVLVATDVAARGLDIDGIELVVNFDLPEDAENYVHRIGRTGRAGNQGRAISLVSDKDVEALARIETYLKNKIESAWLDDEFLLSEFKKFPSADEIRKDRGSRKDQSKSQRRENRPHRKRSGSSQSKSASSSSSSSSNKGPKARNAKAVAMEKRKKHGKKKSHWSSNTTNRPLKPHKPKERQVAREKQAPQKTNKVASFIKKIFGFGSK